MASLEQALAYARSLPPPLAARQAEEILQVVPGHPQALLILATAHRLDGRIGAASAILEPLARSQRSAAAVHAEWAIVQAELGRVTDAIGSLRHALALKPDMPGGWRLLGDLLTRTADQAAAESAYARHVQEAVADPVLMQAGRALVQNDLAKAEKVLRARIEMHPSDVAALRMLAEACTRLGRYADAENLLAQCLALLPGFIAARHNYAVVLFRQNRAEAALPHIRQILAQSPGDPSYRNLLAACLAMTAEYGAAIETYRDVLRDYPDQPKIWLSYGHALKTAGHSAQALLAYRTAALQAPGYGEAYWSLANMKGDALTDDDLGVMQTQLARADLAPEDRFHLHYAIGYMLERRAQYEDSFTNYAKGAALRRAGISYDADRTTAQFDRIRAVMTAEFFAERHGAGCMDEAPIFIVGLPRSGSTLIEQILSSHSAVEGTMELPELANIAREIGGGEGDYLDALGRLSARDLAGLGGLFLQRTRIYRKTSKPIFIDKMPNNFVHIGLIRLILPRARIIDARRHPMAACFSAFKQHFARGQHYTYDLTELGRYYSDYLRLMAHFDSVLPGFVYRVHYESMVQETRTEIQNLLENCCLSLEEGCFRFFESDRAVRTASSEQVRRPIFTSAIDNWRHYEAWLGPLAKALDNRLLATFA
jgi:predicted Zn-dependent protease